MTLDTFLIEILVDPEDKGELWYLEGESLLYNPRLRRGYEIRDSIPVLLVEEAVPASDEDHARYEQLPHEVTGAPSSS